MSKFTEIELDDFNTRAGLSNGKILIFLDDYYEYYRNKYPLLVRFFSGDLDKVDSTVITDLNKLITTSVEITGAIDSNDYLLKFLKDWEITDYLEDLKFELYRMSKTSKFLRSSKTNSNFSGALEFTYPLSQQKTIEDVAFEVLNSREYDEEAINIMERNDLLEIDYDLEGGNNLILKVDLISKNSTINSVVDNITGKKALGLDICKKITFINDDLKVLDYEETARQSVDILSNLYKTDHPEFKTLGRSRIIGYSSNSILPNSIFRELTKVFSSDDTLINFTVSEAKTTGDTTIVNFKVSARLDLIINQNIKI